MLEWPVHKRYQGTGHPYLCPQLKGPRGSLTDHRQVVFLLTVTCVLVQPQLLKNPICIYYIYIQI